jgi:hypothetical protein
MLLGKRQAVMPEVPVNGRLMGNICNSRLNP